MKGKPSLTQLTTSYCAFAFCTIGLLYGCSPLVLPVSAAMQDGSKESTENSYAGGYFLYGITLLSIMFNVAGFVLAFWLPTEPVAAAMAQRTSLFLWSMGLISLAVSVHLQLPWLFFVSFVVLSYPLAVYDLYLCHIELPLAWKDAGVQKGVAILGMSIGSGAIFWTLLTGEVTSAFGVIPALWTLAGSQITILLLVQFMLNPEDIFWRRSSSIETNPNGTTWKSRSAWVPSPSRAAELLKSIQEIASDWRAWVYCYIIVAMCFCGMSFKMLISIIFEHALELDYADSARLSVCYLILYCFGRGLSPLFIVRDKVFSLFAWILATEAVAYGITPWALGLEENRIEVYIILRMFSGGGFAILLGNLTLLSVRIFGVLKNHQVLGLLMALHWISGIGPSVAWYLHVAEVKSGTTVQASYNVFFYLCSAIAASATICVLIVRRSTIRADTSPDCDCTDARSWNSKHEDDHDFFGLRCPMPGVGTLKRESDWVKIWM